MTLWKYQTRNAEKAIVIKSSIAITPDNNQQNQVDPSSLIPEKDFLRVCLIPATNTEYLVDKPRLSY